MCSSVAHHGHLLLRCHHVYGLLYILFTAFTFVYQGIYSFNSRSAGLSFISGGVGNLVGVVYTGFLFDGIIKNKQQNGITTPKAEDWLSFIITVPAATLLPWGLIMYGWTANKGVHSIALMIGTGLLGFDMLGLFLSMQSYLIDACSIHAASITAANAV